MTMVTWLTLIFAGHGIDQTDESDTSPVARTTHR